MLANERYLEIINILEKQGSVTVTQLSNIFNISIETVRRDLLTMEKSGALQRVYGGATLNKHFLRSQNYNERIKENIDKKRELCKRAMSFIKENDTIFLDAGTTVTELALLIKNNIKKLTVITNSLDIIEILSQNDGINIICIGGIYDSNEKMFYGSSAINTINDLYAEKAFLFPAAISLTGFFCNNDSSVILHRAFMNSSSKTYILADSSKFGGTALSKVSNLTKNMTIITDSHLDKNTVKQYKDLGYSIII